MKTLTWCKLTEEQIGRIWQDNSDYLFWNNGAVITKKQLLRFLIDKDETVITLPNVDFYIEL